MLLVHMDVLSRLNLNTNKRNIMYKCAKNTFFFYVKYVFLVYVQLRFSVSLHRFVMFSFFRKWQSGRAFFFFADRFQPILKPGMFKHVLRRTFKIHAMLTEKVKYRFRLKVQTAN